MIVRIRRLRTNFDENFYEDITNYYIMFIDKFYFAISIGENVPQSDRRFHYFDMQLTAHEGLRNDKRVVHLGTIFEYCDTVLKILTVIVLLFKNGSETTM